MKFAIVYVSDIDLFHALSEQQREKFIGDFSECHLSFILNVKLFLIRFESLKEISRINSITHLDSVPKGNNHQSGPVCSASFWLNLEFVPVIYH